MGAMQKQRVQYGRRIARQCLAAVLTLVLAGACDEGLEGVDPESLGSATLRFYNFVLPDTGGPAIIIDVSLKQQRVYETGLGYAVRSGAHVQDLIDLPRSSTDESHLAEIRVSETDSASALVTTGVWIAQGRHYDLLATGRPGSSGSHGPRVMSVLRDRSAVPAGQSRLQLVHAIPDYDSLDVYFGTQWIATLAGFRSDAVVSVTPESRGGDSLTVTLTGVLPAFDGSVDIYHSSSVSLVADSTTTMVLSYREGETTPGGQNEAIFQYLE
jgi:hypothetical protein